MSGFVTKFKSWVTGGDEYEDEVYSIDDAFEPETNQLDEMFTERPRPRRERDKKLKVVEHPGTGATQVIVIEPKAFEEALEIVEYLRAKKSVILNLHLLDTAQSQRVVDFLSGATHAIDGHQQRIGDGVFIFTPTNVEISTEQGNEMDFSSDALWKQSRPKY